MKMTVLKIVFIFFILGLQSCASGPKTISEIDTSVSQANYAAAVSGIENLRNVRGSVYNPDRNAILFYLDRGMVNYYAGFFSDSARDLEEAERLIEEAFTRSITMEIATFIANDNAREYPGEDFEDLYINIFNALNYYNRDNMEGALVEIRRANEKLTVLADRYERTRERAVSADRNMPTETVTEAANFSNSALARYISLIFFRSIGRVDDVRIDYEELHRAFELAPAVYNHPIPGSISQERSVPQGMARLNIIGFTGMSPVKQEENLRIPLPLPYPNSSALVSLPRMVDRSSAIESIEVVLNTGQSFNLELLEDMSRVARETFRARYSNIVLKTTARSIAKATSGAVAARAAEERGGTLMGITVGILSRVAADASENADLRMSRFFPAQAHVGGINLEPGVYSITVNYYGRGRNLIASERRDNVPVREGVLNLSQFVRKR